MEVDGECEAFVSDINDPPTYGNSSEESYDEFQEETDKWMDKWTDIGDEILDDDDAPSCYVDSYESSGLDTFQFTDRDAAGQMTDGGGDALVHVQMTQGNGISWSLLSVSIYVDGGASFTCEEVGTADADCTYTVDDDNYWDVSEEITIYEGDYLDLCDGSNGGCSVNVTITKIGVGGEDSRVISEISAYAGAN